ncbi:MAG: hypothetical protein IKI57_01140 [Clostridia bacterium]|nr:hypothetical protein [Clostridia bacterium]
MTKSKKILMMIMVFTLLLSSICFVKARDKGDAAHTTDDATHDGGYGGNDIINDMMGIVDAVVPPNQQAMMETVVTNMITSNDNQLGLFNTNHNINNDSYSDNGGFDKFGHQDGTDGRLIISEGGNVNYTEGSTACTFWGDGSFFDTNSNYDSSKEQAFSQEFRKAVADGTITNAEQAEAWCQENSNGKIHYYEGEIFKEAGQNAIDYEGKEGWVALIGIKEPDATMNDALNYDRREMMEAVLKLYIVEYLAKLTNMDDSQVLAMMNLLSEYLEGNIDQITKFGPIKDDDSDDPKPNGQPWATLDKSFTHRYKSYESNGSYSISNPEYDVSTAIPTSETLDFSGSANDQLFDINVRTWVYNNGVSNVKLYQDIVWYNFETVTHYGTRQKKDKDGNVVKDASGDIVYEDYSWQTDEWVYKNTFSGTEPVINRSFTRSSKARFYDVPSPVYYGAQSLTVSGAPVPGSMGLTAGPEPAGYTISPKKPVPAPNLTQITHVVRTWFSNEENSIKAMANSPTDSSRQREREIQAACDGIAPSPASKSYSHRGLTVSTYSGPSGYPGVKRTSGSDNGKVIPETSHNGLWETSGSVSYRGYSPQGASGNNVFVHTPVVAQNIAMNSSKFVNQLVSSKKQAETDEFKYFQLDEGIEIKIPDKGNHISAKGYGNNQTYNSDGNKTTAKKVTSWGAIKDVRFPFDVYVHSDDNKSKYLLPRMTWLSQFVDDNSLISKINYKKSRASTGYKFTIPVWVEEKLYKEADETKLDDANLEHGIQIRIIAENAKANDGINKMEKEANKDEKNYVAYKCLSCEIIGKIYDLRINESTDVDWKTKVQSGLNANYKGGVRSNEFPFGRTLVAAPLVRSQNVNPAYHYATKLGYTFVFNFKTKGRKSNNIEVAVSKNGFYFVPKSGGNATKVDLYYKNNNGKFIKITEGNGNKTLGVTLTNQFMGVDPIEFTNSTRIYPLETFTPEPINKTKIGKYNYSLKVNVGDLSKLKLPHSLRLVYNNMNEYQTDNGGRGLYGRTASQIINDAGYSKQRFVSKYGFDGNETNADFITGSVGHWYVGYALPTTTVAVAPNADPNNPANIKKEGYILVRFDIISDHKEEDDPQYLQYKGPEYLNETKGGTEYILPEKEKDPGKDWTKPEPGLEWPTDKTNPNKKKRITLPGTNGPITVDVPTDTVAIFETDYSSSQTDINSVINN